MKNKICTLIHKIDTTISRQIHAMLHHPRLQQLEAAWRGLYYLVHEIPCTNNPHLKVRLLNINWHEVNKDVTRAADFDQSQLFTKIYNHEFDQPGGEPFSLLIGDYNISHQPPDNPIATLSMLSKIAAAAFVPFIASAHPNLFGLDNYVGLSQPINLERLFQQQEYQRWKKLRTEEDSRFIGLVLPSVLVRLPYTLLTDNFQEETQKLSDYLWGNTVYCFAITIAQAFIENGWFVNNHHGYIKNLPREKIVDNTFKYSTITCITDAKEKLLSDHGFISLCECKYTTLNAFYSYPSIQTSKQLTSNLLHLLCASRFAHYIKMIMRDKTGSFSTAEECEYYLQSWLHQYTSASSELSPELKAKYPLRAAKIKIQENPGKPGTYQCTIHLCPHIPFEQITSQLRLTTEIKKHHDN